MADFRETRLRLGGFATRCLELRPQAANDSTVLFLHGFSDSADTWRPLLTRMRRGHRRAVAVDLPGFGAADRLDREEPILPQLDRLVAAAVERAAADSPTGHVTVAGNSLGGLMSLRVAERHDLPVDGVMPIAPAGLDMASWIGAIEGAWAIQTILRSPLPLPEPAVRELVGQAFRRLAVADPARLDRAQLARFTSHVRTKRDVVRILGTGRRLRPELTGAFHLDRIRCPVLIVWGQNDRMVFASGAERVVSEVPTARLITLPDCGHCPQLDCPERVLELLEEFPAQVAAAAA